MFESKFSRTLTLNSCLKIHMYSVTGIRKITEKTQKTFLISTFKPLLDNLFCVLNYECLH